MFDERLLLKILSENLDNMCIYFMIHNIKLLNEDTKFYNVHTIGYYNSHVLQGTTDSKALNGR